MKKAMISGIAGQDGSYLAELLLSKGYEVHGLVRSSYIEKPYYEFERIKHLIDKITLHSANVESFPAVYRVVNSVKPEEFYHLAAESYVSFSLEDELATITKNISGIHNILAAISQNSPDCKLYFAGSSEMFGDTNASPQTENASFSPRSAYGVSKLAGHHILRNFRNQHGVYAVTGILFNHESPRRSKKFVTRKISSAVAKIKFGMQNELRLGNIDSRRDWGHARDYVLAMWKMLQQDTPDDFIVATGKTHSIRDFLQIAFGHVGLNYENFVVEDPDLLRPSDTIELCGDARKAHEKLNWTNKIEFEQLVIEMVEADLSVLGRGSN